MPPISTNAPKSLMEVIGDTLSHDYLSCAASSSALLNSSNEYISDNQGELVVYPNPAWNSLEVEASQIIAQVTILDLTGKVVKSTLSNMRPIQVSLEGIPTGMYILRVRYRDTDAFELVKFVKAAE